MKTCPKCRKQFPDTNEYFYVKSKATGKRQSYCKQCNHQNTLDRQREFKNKIVEYMGGKCARCGYNKCNAALQFHHLDPTEKDFNLSKVRHTSWKNNSEKIKTELDKCIMLCANCHFEEHALYQTN